MSVPLTLTRPRHGRLRPGLLTAIAAGLASALTGEELTLEPGEPRGFIRLLGTPSYEAWLIAWATGGSLELHDHGGSAGAVHVVEGALTEVYADLDQKQPLRSRSVRAGDHLAIPATRVHEVWNAGPELALSVHVYSPPITTMTFFDPDPSRYLAPLRTERPEVDTAP